MVCGSAGGVPAPIAHQVEATVRQLVVVALVAGMGGGLALGGGDGAPRVGAAALAQADSWSERAPMLMAHSEHSIAQLDGRIFVLGGYPGARITADLVQVYDSQTDSWSTGPSLPLPL